MNYIEKMISNLSTQHGTENLELRAIFNTLQDQLNTVMNSKLTWEDADNLLMSEDDVLTDQNAVELDSELWVDIRDIQFLILYDAIHKLDKTMDDYSIERFKKHLVNALPLIEFNANEK